MTGLHRYWNALSGKPLFKLVNDVLRIQHCFCFSVLTKKKKKPVLAVTLYTFIIVHFQEKNNRRGIDLSRNLLTIIDLPLKEPRASMDYHYRVALLELGSAKRNE